jgi:hypothetical protein
MNRKYELLQMLENDPFDLLKDVKPKVATHRGEEQITIEFFEEITKFFELNGYEPQKSDDNREERKLHNILQSIRADKDKVELLKSYDRCRLLEDIVEDKKIESFADMLESAPFGLLADNGSNDIFTLKHIEKKTTMPDYVANRKACKDFEQFEPLFKQCQADLESNIRIFSKYHGERFIKKGMFFVLKGLLGYVAEIGEKKTEDKRTNARLRCIFSNGTESDMLLRSLSAELYKVGKLITPLNSEFENEFSQIGSEDIHDGYIYILESLNSDEKIQQIKDLYKIGYSTTRVEERIKNAKNEPTYLMADIRVVMKYKTYNMNTQKFEQLLHQFFGNSCLDISIVGNDGKSHNPREWFTAPLAVIKQAIDLLITQEIIFYKYEKNKEDIVLRK